MNTKTKEKNILKKEDLPIVETFQGSLGEFQVVKTLDGSLTVWSEFFQEACHSYQGANQETLLYYIEGCEIIKRFHHYPQFHLLDIGFGLGLSYQKTIEQLMRQQQYKNSSTFLTYVSVEIDEGLILWGKNHTPYQRELSNFPQQAQLEKSTWLGIPCYQAEAPQGKLIILLGDARENLKRLSHHLSAPFSYSFHAIYQDAFSPQKNPTLWTVEWFELLKSLSHPQTILSTFSGAMRMRKALLEAGWSVAEGKTFGTKRRSSLARWKEVSETEPTLYQKIISSPVDVLRDQQIR